MSLDLDSSDNLSDEILNKFITRHGSQLQSCILSGMSHVTDQLWMAILPLLTNAKILVMGTSERLGVNIHVDQLMDAIACNCPKLERLELRLVKVEYSLCCKVIFIFILDGILKIFVSLIKVKRQLICFV